MTRRGDFATTLTFTPDDTGVEMTVQQRAQTIQQLLAELEAAGALPAGAVSWDANLEALVLDLSFQSGQLARSAGVDAGNGLAADTHLTGCRATPMSPSTSVRSAPTSPSASSSPRTPHDIAGAIVSPGPAPSPAASS